MKGRILIVDDDRDMCELLHAGLRKRFEPTWELSAEGALALLATEDFDAVVTDLNMRGMNGVELCERIAGSRPNLPVIVISAFGSMEAAVSAIRVGAYDFIAKPFEIEALALVLDRAIKHGRLRHEVTRLRTVVSDPSHASRLPGTSAAMRGVQELIDRVAEIDAAVLITGESGTGKELVARELHARSKRRDGPFIAINCAAMPASLLESELFGHAKGAFTDAKSQRKGLFVQAQSGTLFLDEIGDLPLEQQPKLLRALQERTIRPIGSDEEIAFDARIITASNRDLETAVEEKRFRKDLFYRINVIHIGLPPLRARGRDVLVIARQFVNRFATQFDKCVVGIAGPASEKLLAYPWPGNIRELQNAIERAVALTRREQVDVEDLPPKIREYRKSHVLVTSDDPSELVPLEEVERHYILRVLESFDGNRALTARTLCLDPKTLYRKLQQYGVQSMRDPTSLIDRLSGGR